MAFCAHHAHGNEVKLEVRGVPSLTMFMLVAVELDAHTTPHAKLDVPIYMRRQS